MERIPSSPPIISPLKGAPRPRWSVMIPAFNCIGFLEETLLSVLRQALPEADMQIMVVDDGSTDGDVEALVKATGSGRIAYTRNEINQGSLRTFAQCIRLAKGYWVHLLHGDDKVHAGYYAAVEALLKRWPEAGAAFCRFRYVDEAGKHLYTQPAEAEEAGILNNWLYKISVRNRVQFSAITVKREVYEELGSFYGVTYGEDWEMWVRIASRHPVAYLPEILADYRKHWRSITGDKITSGAFLDDLEKVMLAIQQWVPPDIQPTVLLKAKRFYACYGMRTAHQVWHAGHNQNQAKAVAKRALLMHQSFPLYWEALKLDIKIFLKRLL